ncbi:outer membrane protein assembly factor BamD [Hoylesella buccalis]|uniref:outer membrane protein assembly factor BamD n=1 Tax=Hoylesella buccalis TaxID=28127 RepID=UPI001D099E0E|nr:outer membrane protein assembly factor BamD [Hoylesella buccalis]MCB6900772.1 outer membrane protein assembly factor BamD [Hoylesella buccalis]UEA63122.1 outer membrane protein assembly factor BamD [Hoylesella buccalis]UWP49588.1 outer membrane protein assembly factor BamD [Hoylesella buccalis ATCC 35310]
MKKLFFISTICVALLFGSCASEFNAVYKSTDSNYRYEYAKECFFKGKYTRAITLLNDLIVVQKGTENAQESLYMLAMAQYKSGDYESAAQAFKRYIQSYPKGKYAELASYYVGESLYMCTPEPRLDQSQTVSAIASFQEFLDLFPDAKLKNSAQNRLFELQDKLVKKELYSAQLYYDLGPYFGNCTSGGNNYEACIITAENALKDYPYSSLRENFAVLVMKSKFELAEQSVEEKRLERYQDAEDECYGFINEYPDSKQRPLAEKFIKKCKEVTKTGESNS